MHRSRLATMAFLRDAVPEETEDLDDNQLFDLVVRSEIKGDELGFETEYGHGLWACLAVMTGGAALTDTQLHDQFREAEYPDDEIEEVFEVIANSDEEELMRHM